MSRAFVKESEGEWLGDVAPDLIALEHYLTKEHSARIYQIAKQIDEDSGREVHKMSDGYSYMLDDDGRWSRLYD